MQRERRTSKRDKFVKRPDGGLILTVGNDQHEVADVIDVSIHGIGLAVGAYIDPGRTAQVIYNDGDAVMSITGTVTYCEQRSHPGYRVGLMFDFPRREESEQFYRSVRKYLDT